MHEHLTFMSQLLLNRVERGNQRKLKANDCRIDFFSNDYLGFAGDPAFQQLIWENVKRCPAQLTGSTGSRLISGTSRATSETEASIAREHGVESALLFTSGYTANLSLFSSLAQRGDTILVDEYIHRSVHDGCMLSMAQKWKFQHNDLCHLETLLKKAKGKCLVAVESLYSMEGDFAPLKELVSITERYGAALIIDEAHAFGVWGYGLATQHQLQNRVLATVVTYGKAMGLHGAAILTQQLTKDYLVNYAAPFIYTTAPGDLAAVSISLGYDHLKQNTTASACLQEIIKQFRNAALTTKSMAGSPIQVIEHYSLQQLEELQTALAAEGMATYLVKAPSVKAGSERIRVCLHAFNSEREVALLTSIIKHYL
ncbi:aminotransferase class I/II-fold pyridoxal phosphate-dependent enzyme [Filimonas effusa]|uniref:Pyridoxal phosphate-dependent aminotransferase family protein n=1 Tax=Filimonas effusa TaxID=2508721 RepID=A0A4Q1DA17_9BACT|nr:pyridoxal phosphate-dependent aminotransferase family protein [Filimonas effusa]RXK86211.1 pyridoxal phosphate-dependent aminotransferase family protein [Filimonas effusa]